MRTFYGRRAMRAAAGLSLLEMLVVVVIVGILAITVVPRRWDIVKDEDELENCVRSVNLYFRRLRQTAVSRLSKVCFETDLTNNKFSKAWIEQSGDSLTFDPTDELLSFGTMEMSAFGDNIVLQRGNTAGTEFTTGTQVSCVNHRGNQTGDQTTIHVGDNTHPSAGGNDGDQFFWRSWTFQDISGFYRYYPCGRNGDFPANDC